MCIGIGRGCTESDTNLSAQECQQFLVTSYIGMVDPVSERDCQREL